MFKLFAICGSIAFWLAFLIAWAHEQGLFSGDVKRWKAQPWVVRICSIVLVGALVVFAGTKPDPSGGGTGGDTGDDPAVTNVVEGTEGDVTNVVGDVNGEANTNDVGGALMLGMFRGAPTQGETGGEDDDTEPEVSTNAPISHLSRITHSMCAAGFTIQGIGTNETFDFSAPEGAFVATNWILHGAANARIHTDLKDWTFPFGNDFVTNLAAFASGKVMTDTANPDQFFAPFAAPLGVPPEANWGELDETNRPSIYWQTMTENNAFICTWQNVLLDRAPTNPVSFQVEFRPGGSFIYRYDLSRLPSEECLTNVVIGVKNGDGEWFAPTVGRSLTSLKFARVTLGDLINPDRDGDGVPTEVELFDLGTDPDLADSDFDGKSDGEEFAAGTNPNSRDSDNDGLVDGIDPDPTTSDAFVDEDHDGIDDNLERTYFGDTSVIDDPTEVKEDGFSLETEILAGINPTNPAPTAVTYITNSLVSWKLFDGFAAQLPSAGGVLWGRSFRINKTSPWQQYFVSAAPDSAAGWMLEGMLLEWEDSNGNGGSVARSPSGDSWRIPLSTNETANITLCLRATGAFVRTATPLYLIAYTPEFKVNGGNSFTGDDGVEYSVFTDGSDSSIGLEIDRSHRPSHTGALPEESDMSLFEQMSSESGDFVFEGDENGGSIRAYRPGIYDFPDIETKLSAAPRPRLMAPRLLGAGNGGGRRVVILSPSVGWTCNGDGCGWGGLGYDWTEDWYYEESDYPLDSSCLRSRWHHSYGGGWWCDGTFYCSSGCGDGGGVRTETDGNRGTVYVGGVAVWSDTAEHVHDHTCGGGDSLETEGCCGDCRNGNCDSTEGAKAGSLKFRIPLGSPADGFVSGFAYFDTKDPLTISKSIFQLKMHHDAQYTDTTGNGVRTIVCNDQRGRTLLIESIAGGVRITIRMTETQSLEHTWEITNVGSSSVIRLRKISRLENVMEDETYRYEEGDWVRFDNIAQIREEVSIEGGINDPYSDWTKREYRTTYDANGDFLSEIVTDMKRVGECDNAVLREVYRRENTGYNWRETWADYWDDPQHPRRHGKMRLRYGNDAPWQYADFDEYGRETIRVEQRNGSQVPGSFPYAVSNVLYAASDLADAFVTVYDYAPIEGDADHIDDAALPRTETKYVVTGGAVTLIGRTWRRYTRFSLGLYDTVKVETWRAATATAERTDAANATSYEVIFADSGDDAPLAMRGAVVESLDESGIKTENSYTRSGKVVTCESRKSYGANAYPTYTVTETDADYGNVLRVATYLTAGDVLLTEERSTYDDQNRLRSTVYSDGTSLTNSYSCCRLLWKRDREGRKTIRSGVTGTDHLYNAEEEVWLADISTNGGYRVTQHFFDALGRETNTAVYVGFTPNEANTADASAGKVVASATTAYPYGGSDYSVSTDERGKVTETYRSGMEECEYSEVYTSTNGVNVLIERTTNVRGGRSTTRREWRTGILSASTMWTEESRFTDYSADGCRIDFTITSSPDCGTVTNSIVVYDWLGRLVSSETPLGVTTYAYDGASSRALTTTYEAGSVSRSVSYIYDAQGERVGFVQDDVTQRSDISYEVASGVVWRVTRETTVGPDTNALTVVRERLSGLGNGLIFRVETAEENGPNTTEEKTRDAATGITTETRTSSVGLPTVTRRNCGLVVDEEADGVTRYYTYDPFGRNVRTEKTVARSSSRRPVSESVYNAFGDVVLSALYTNANDVATETYAYDSFGRKVLTVNALGVETVTAYDANSNVVSEEGAIYPVRYAYDSQNRRVAMWTNRSGDEWDMTRWAYNPATGLCTSKTYEDGSIVTYEYTPDGLLETTRTADGHWTRNIYDAKRQLVGVQYDDASNVTYGRDAYGRESSAANGNAAYAYTLASCGIATSESVTIGVTNYTLLRGLDDQGRITSFGIENSGPTSSLNFGYRPDGRIGNVTNGDVTVDYAYSDDGYDTGYTLAVEGGVTFVRTLVRDPYRRDLVTAVVNSQGANYAYSYDALSRPRTRNDDVFAYNARSEVTGATAAGEVEGYTYDNIGNATFAFAGSVTNTYAANGLNQYVAVCSDGVTVESVYDADGNLVSFGDWSYAYDSAARLTEVRSNGVLVASNYYDHQGRRVRLVTSEASYTFIYDGWNVVLELVDHDGVTDRIEYYWGKDISGSLQGAGGVEGLLCLKHNGSIFVPIYDAYGNVMEYRAADGSLAASYIYDAFGRTISQTGPLADVFRCRYSTKSFDAATGLYYYGKRFYSPELRRWINRDPIGEEGGNNLYAVCCNNLLREVDVLGQNRYITQFDIAGLGGSGGTQLHVGVAVDTWECKGGKWVKTGVVTFDFAPKPKLLNLVKAAWKAEGVIVESHGLTLEAPITLKSTPEQDIKMLEMIRKEIGSPPFYNALFHNCVFWSVGAVNYGM